MKAFLALVIGAAVVYFLIRRQPAMEHSSVAPATPLAHTALPGPMPPAAPQPPAIAAQPTAQSTALYKQLLRPAYLSLIDGTEKATNLRGMNPEVAELRALFSTVPQAPERDAALRLCAIVDQAATLTRSVVQRKNQSSSLSQPSSKGGAERARAAKETEERDTFFSQAAENQWRAQIGPLQAAARNEWAQIPDNAILSSNSLPAYAAARIQRQRLESAAVRR